MIFRNQVRERYTVVDNNILTNRDLNLKNRGMLITLLSLPDHWEFSEQGLVAILQDGISGIRSSLKDLERLGYLERRRVRDEKGRLVGTEYHIHELPVSEKPILDYPTLEKPILENHIQSITNISNTNLIKKDICSSSTNEPVPKPIEKAKTQHDEQFEQFWCEYPKKFAKAKAKQIWIKLKPNDELFEKIMDSIQANKETDDWLKDNGRYIPHATTWLNQERWDDELPNIVSLQAIPMQAKVIEEDPMERLLREQEEYLKGLREDD